MKRVTFIRLISVLSVLAVFTANAIQAQNHWEKVASPLGGTVVAMIEANNGALIAATDEGTYRSSDVGATWTLVSGGMRNNYNTDLFKNANGQLYAIGVDRTTEASRLFISGDHGLSWVEVPNIPDEIYPVSIPPTQLIVVNSNGDHFVGGTESPSTVPGHVIRSTDNGATWTPVFSSSILGSSIVVTDLEINSTNTLFVSAAVSSAEGLYRSTDNGANWTQVYDDRIRKIFIAPNDDVYIIAGNSWDQLLHSSDHGDTWTDISPTGLPTTFLPLAAIWVDNNNDIFLGVSLLWPDGAVGGRGVARSTDGGTTWTVSQSGFPAARHFIHDYVGVETLFRHSSGRLFAGTNATGAALTANQGLGGICYSEDNGDTWNESNSGMSAIRFTHVQASAAGEVIASPYWGLLYSGNSGNDWEDRSPLRFNGSPFEIEALGKHPQIDTLLAGFKTEVYRSSDAGNSWELSGSGLLSGDLRELVINNDGDFFAAQTAGFARLQQDSTNWEFLMGGGGGVDILAAANGTLFGILGLSGAWRSTDNGDNWESVNPGLVRQLAGGPGNDVYAAANFIYYSPNNGDSWQRIDNNGIPQGSGGFTRPEIFALETNPAGHLYVSARYTDILDIEHFGIFRTTDNGASWDLLNSGLEGAYTKTQDISFDPSGRAYLATTDGIYRSTQPVGIDDSPENQPINFELAQNYPNPFNPVTNIGFRNSEFGFIELAIYDITGRLIKTLVSENRAPGSYSVQWDGSNDLGQQVSSGIYIYRLQAGNFFRARKMILLK